MTTTTTLSLAEAAEHWHESKAAQTEAEYERHSAQTLERLKSQMTSGLTPHEVDEEALRVWENDSSSSFSDRYAYNRYIVYYQNGDIKVRAIMATTNRQGWHPVLEVAVDPPSEEFEEAWAEFGSLDELHRITTKQLKPSIISLITEPEQEESPPALTAQETLDMRINQIREEPENSALEMLAVSMGMGGHDMDPLHTALLSCAASLISISKDIQAVT